jgi:hypothetical protein
LESCGNSRLGLGLDPDPVAVDELLAEDDSEEFGEPEIIPAKETAFVATSTSPS